MKKKGYADFNDEKVEEIVMGVPITLSPGQVVSPCFPQLPTNFTNPQQQTYQLPNGLPGVPPSVGVQQQIFPQLQTQYAFIYI
jgi:hypothetical protein